MDRLRSLGDRYALEQLQRWGPSTRKISWEELCKRKCLPNPMEARKISGEPLFMSEQLLKLPSSYGSAYNNHLDILSALRPEDACHIPLLRVDKAGIVIDWNRSMCDLTGIPRAQVVGKSYSDVLNEFLPNLTNEYKKAAVGWLSRNENETSEYSNEEDCREDYLFPLPLPLRYDNSSFKYASVKNRHHDEFIELLVGRADNLLELYPTFNSSRGVPQYGIIGDRSRWFFDTRGWIGGMEFTLKRKQYVPSLQVLCSDLLPRGETIFSKDGSLASVVATSALKSSGGEEGKADEDVYGTISKYIQSCDRTGMRYILEVLHNVRRSTRNTMRDKKFYFSDDWSTYPATSSVNKVVLLALGGPGIIVQAVEKGKMTWSYAFGSKSAMSKEEKREVESKQMARHRVWLEFITCIAPVGYGE